MTPPQISGYELMGKIGEGASGTVYSAHKNGGGYYAVKVFESMSSNPALLESRMMRIVSGGAQDVTVPILARALDVRPACVVMPLLGDKMAGEDDSDYRPQTLQTQLLDFLQTAESWPMAVMLAERLAVLHTVRVAHGNLKPGNIFLNEEGLPIFSDYAEGLMPGVHHLSYSDALLYAPPEQLRHPDGYSEEAGYRWDVYAFGVLAFRLVSGIFPRCDEMFQKVSPEPGRNCRFMIEADHAGIAEGLEEDNFAGWPENAKDERELRRRKIIESCLNLNPLDRPCDLNEVAHAFERIDRDLKVEAADRAAKKALNSANSKRSRARALATVLFFIAGALGTMWGLTEMARRHQLAGLDKEYSDFRDDSATEVAGLESERDDAHKVEKTALAAETLARKNLAEEQEKAVEELKSLSVSNDNLFHWVLERGVENLPALQSREGRLALLRENVQKQIAGMETRPGLEARTARLRFQLAEILLAEGKADEGQKLLSEVMAKNGDLITKEERALSGLRLAMLESEKKTGLSDATLAAAQKASAIAWDEDSPEFLRAEAVLSLLEARRMEAGEETGKSMIAYQKALADFSKLRDQFPENLALRSHVAKGYLESARAAEGLGAMEDAAVLRGKAANEYLALMKKSGRDMPEAAYQVASARAAQALAEWSKGDVFEAEKVARQAIKELLAVREKMPDDFRVMTDIASQQGIIATSLRDEGRKDEAEKLLRDAIDELQTGVGKDKMNWKARYLLSSLKWQLSSLLGQSGKRAEEVQLGIEAHDELKLIHDAKPRYPRPEVVQKSMAYLCGDLGMAAYSHGQKDQSVSFFKESREYWKGLLQNEAEMAEYKEGFNWVQGQLENLDAE